MTPQQARELALCRALANSVEVHLANLERLEIRKSSGRREIEVARAFCARMVLECIDLGVDPSGLRGISCERLRLAMEQAGAAQSRATNLKRATGP